MRKENKRWSQLECYAEQKLMRELDTNYSLYMKGKENTIEKIFSSHDKAKRKHVVILPGILIKNNFLYFLFM